MSTLLLSSSQSIFKAKHSLAEEHWRAPSFTNMSETVRWNTFYTAQQTIFASKLQIPYVWDTNICSGKTKRLL